MRRIRTLLTAVCFVALATIAVAATVQTIALGIPDTLSSNASVVIAELSEEDISNESQQAKLRLAKRVQKELQSTASWHDDLAALDAQHRERLTENILLLARESFDSKLEHYFEYPPGRRRDKFLDRQIDDLKSWAVIVEESMHDDGEPVFSPIALMNLLSRVAQEYRNAGPIKMIRLQQFQKALQDRMQEDVKRRFRLDGG